MNDVDALVIVGCGPRTQTYDVRTALPTAHFAPSGPLDRAEVLPLSLAVGAVLAASVAVPIELQAVAGDASPADCAALGRGLARHPGRVGLLIMADGSARRSVSAPGYLDERAAPFDALVEAALRDGDPAGLLALDTVLANELLVGGRAAWQVLAGAFDGQRPQAELVDSTDPFGVWYPVATWRTR